MRLCIQRVKQASVTVDGVVTGSIAQGLLILLGIGHDDTEETAESLAEKCISLRIFGDAVGKMNLGLKDVNGRILVVSQFTLYADTRKGNRPSFTDAAFPEKGKALYDFFCNLIKVKIGEVQTGVFGADMEVALVNDGPVTIWLEK